MNDTIIVLEPEYPLCKLDSVRVVFGVECGEGIACGTRKYRVIKGVRLTVRKLVTFLALTGKEFSLPFSVVSHYGSCLLHGGHVSFAIIVFMINRLMFFSLGSASMLSSVKLPSSI